MFKKITKILGLSFIIGGVTSGIILVKNQQDIRKKAETLCPYDCLTSLPQCQQGTNKGQGYGDCGMNEYCCKKACVDVDGSYCTCCKVDSPCGSSEFSYVKCGASGQLDLSTKYKDSSCNNTCTAGGGSNQDQGGSCGISSDNKCKGLDPGDVCGANQNKECTKIGKGSDGLDKCQCLLPGEGSGESGDQPNGATSNNPDKIGPFTHSGLLTLYFKKFIDSTAPKYALKKNANDCDLTNSDIVIDTATADTNGKISTELFVSAGDFLCIYGEDIGTDAGPYLMEGFTGPDTSNKCGVGKVDISSLIASAQSDGQIIEFRQCWGDYSAKSPEEDFDDYGLVLSVLTQKDYKMDFKVRFQGITTKKADQKVSLILKDPTSIIWSSENIVSSADDNGVYDIFIPANADIPTREYNLLIKGPSHLQKKFVITYNGGSQIYDFATDANDELIAGDINADNAITIEDISLVLKFYTDFSIPVNSSSQEMLSADVNKDGFITIEDVALIALNWSDFIISGEE